MGRGAQHGHCEQRDSLSSIRIVGVTHLAERVTGFISSSTEFPVGNAITFRNGTPRMGRSVDLTPAYLTRHVKRRWRLNPNRGSPADFSGAWGRAAGRKEFPAPLPHVHLACARVAGWPARRVESEGEGNWGNSKRPFLDSLGVAEVRNFCEF